MKKQKGFTLIELLLYIAITSIIVLTTASLLQFTLESRVKNQTIAEVEQEGIQVLQLITQTIRNGTAINSPTIGLTTTSLSVNVVTAASSPTVFDLSGGVLRIQEGTASAVALTNSRVTASSLSFKNLSATGTDGTVQVSFTLTQVNPSGRNEYDYNKTFYGSATLR